MKQLRFIILSLLLFNTLYSTKGFYVSPGLQVGYNSIQGLFYGYQLSMGIVFKTGDHTLPISFVPSVCYGYKIYHKSKMVEKYKDLQITKFHKKITPNFPIGIGLGKIITEGNSTLRIKGYVWEFSNITFDYELSNKAYNLSLIPAAPLPITDMLFP